MRLGYILLYVPDVTAAITWYEAAFGLQRRFISECADYGELDTGGVVIGFVLESLAGSHGFGFQAQRPEGPPPAVELGLLCDDVPAAYARALAAGARPLAPPATKPWGQVVSYVSDLNGFLVELCTPMG